MPSLSFDIKNSEGFLKKLIADYEEFQSDLTSSRLALNCAMTSWHLIDWIYYEFYNGSGSFSSLSDLQRHLKLLCPSLQIMHDLTNGTKHHTLTTHNPSIKDTDLHEGDFGDDFSREDFDVTILEIEMHDGSKKYYEDEIETVILFWKSYMCTNHSICL